ncbi:MAG: hypothetical protein ACO3NZ_05700 [Pirellulales bacterium]
MLQIAFQRSHSALCGGHSRATGGDTAATDSGDVVNAIAIAAQFQDYASGLAALIAAHSVRSKSGGE